SAVQDLVHEKGRAAPAPLQIHTIAGEPAGNNMRAVSVDRRQPLLQCQRSDLLAVGEKHRALQHDHDVHAPARQHLQRLSISSDLLASEDVTSTSRLRPAASSSGACGAAFGSERLVSRPTLLAPGMISRASSICLAGNPARYGSNPVMLPPGR